MANFQPRSQILAKKVTIQPANSADTALEIKNQAGTVVQTFTGAGAGTTSVTQTINTIQAAFERNPFMPACRDP